MASTRIVARVILLRVAGEEPEVLLVRHERPDRAFWCFPGGGVGPGEGVAAAALRELREETGCEADLAGLVAVRDFVQPPRLELFFLGYFKSGQLRLGEDPERAGATPVLRDAAWVRLSQLERYRVLPADLAGDLASGAYRTWPLLPVPEPQAMAAGEGAGMGPGAGPGAPAGWRLEARAVGRVQGVGFRYFVQQRALELGLSGWVRNLADGSVEVVAEGEKSRLEALLAAVRAGPPAARVEAVHHRFAPATGLTGPFRIRG